MSISYLGNALQAKLSPNNFIKLNLFSSDQCWNTGKFNAQYYNKQRNINIDVNIWVRMCARVHVSVCKYTSIQVNGLTYEV